MSLLFTVLFVGLNTHQSIRPTSSPTRNLATVVPCSFSKLRFRLAHRGWEPRQNIMHEDVNYHTSYVSRTCASVTTFATPRCTLHDHPLLVTRDSTRQRKDLGRIGYILRPVQGLSQVWRKLSSLKYFIQTLLGTAEAQRIAAPLSVHYRDSVKQLLSARPCRSLGWPWATIDFMAQPYAVNYRHADQ